MAWDPKAYLAFGGERTRPAAELVARIPLESPERIADLGCGPGNSTELLVTRWAQAVVDGIDNSPAMLAAARASGVPAQWIEADVAHWAPDRSYDVIYSNATLQWVSGHELLLPRLVSFLAPGGVLAFQVPRNFGLPSHTIAQELAKNARWADRLANVRDWWTVREPEQYYGILEPVAAKIDIWETRYLQTLEGTDAVYRWVLGTGLRPFVDALEGEEREAFLAEYRARVSRAYASRVSGITLFPFQRLFCIASRAK
ncbi:MAG TPA: methyltransferase domain-containing protein [Rhizomicrobium sp.]|nr:methyltransferase domain-containing protein [Rhizomicrobium sp.]